MGNQHKLHVEIARTLEEIQEFDPLRYGWWYSRLYPVKGGPGLHWSEDTLNQLKTLLSVYA